MPVKHFYLTGRFFSPLPRLYRIDGGKADARASTVAMRAKRKNPRSAFGAPAGFRSRLFSASVRGKTCGPLKKSLHKLLGVEQFEIVHLLAHADEHDGDLQFPAQREHKPALGGAVQLGEHDAVQFDRLVKDLRL